MALVHIRASIGLCWSSMDEKVDRTTWTSLVCAASPDVLCLNLLLALNLTV